MELTKADKKEVREILEKLSPEARSFISRIVYLNKLQS
jgi:hypothetical protein